MGERERENEREEGEKNKDRERRERGEREREREMVRERERKTKIGRKNSIPLGNNKTFKREKTTAKQWPRKQRPSRKTVAYKDK